jgi:hypothetical protein
MDLQTGVILRGFDISELVKIIARLNRKYQATLLSQVENLDREDNLDYPKIRKLILDSSNGYTREIVTLIFGPIEF